MHLNYNLNIRPSGRLSLKKSKGVGFNPYVTFFFFLSFSSGEEGITS